MIGKLRHAVLPTIAQSWCQKVVGPPTCQLSAQLIRSRVLKWLKEQILLILIFLNSVDHGIVLKGNDSFANGNSRVAST